jgi:molecular chaperone DnaJ
MIRNYFSDLELDHKADLDEVKAAYRRLAKLFHPDHQQDNPAAPDLFRKIQEAYDHLDTPTKISRLRGKLSKIHEVEVSSITSWRKEQTTAPGQPTRAKAKDHLDLHLTLSLSDRVLKKGGKERFQFVYEKPCQPCKGKGGVKNSVSVTCKKCAGLGSYQIARGNLQWRKTCELCYGKGHQVINPCPSCAGKGKVAERQAVEVKIPPEVDLHQEVCLKNLGHMSFDGHHRGDLWLTLVKAEK